MELVLAVLQFLRFEDVAVGHRVVPAKLPDLPRLLEVHGDALEPVGELDGDRVQGDSAGLLEVGELGDLQAVEPDLPPQAPCPEGRLLPVVFDKPDVVLFPIETEGFEAVEV